MQTNKTKSLTIPIVGVEPGILAGGQHLPVPLVVPLAVQKIIHRAAYTPHYAIYTNIHTNSGLKKSLPVHRNIKLKITVSTATAAANLPPAQISILMALWVNCFGFLFLLLYRLLLFH